jgi:hypothetical protein
MTEKSEHIIRQEHFVSGWESGEEAERSRIIALLENMRDECQEADDLHGATIVRVAQTLIKGENK